MPIQIFYNGLNVATKQMLDVAAEGSLYSKQLDATQILIEEMATNGYQWSSQMNKPNREARIYEVDALTILATQVEPITKRPDGIPLRQQQAPIMFTSISHSWRLWL